MFCCYAIVEEAERMLGRKTKSKLQLNNSTNGISFLQTSPDSSVITVADKSSGDVRDMDNNNN